MTKTEKINGHYVDTVKEKPSLENQPLKDRVRLKLLLIRDNIEAVTNDVDEILKLLD